MIEIDLNARVLTEAHSAFIVRPGNGYGLFSEITQRSLLVLELPGLALTSGVRPSDDDLRRRVNRSRALRAWYRAGQDSGSKPENDLQAYTTGGGNSTGQLAGLVRTFFEKMKVGDLVIVPPKSYMGDAWIGEITGAEYEVETITVGRLFGEEPLPARSVRWLTRIPKRELPYSILEALEKPNAAFLVERSHRALFYKIAYGNYSIDDYYSALFEVTSPDFDTHDDVLLQAFFNFVAANTKAVIEDEEPDVLGFADAAFRDSGEYVAKLQINVNSPGNIALVSKVITPLVASVLFLLAVEVGPSARAEAQNGTLVLRNSKAVTDDPCTAKVFESSIQILKLLNLDEWPAACMRAQEVANKIGLKSPARVERRQ